tara:strand:- start:41 stop:202 length:162 start_codon:yes stop_codon:yes gene_type:complete
MNELSLQITEISNELSTRLGNEEQSTLTEMLENEDWNEELLDELSNWLGELVV